MKKIAFLLIATFISFSTFGQNAKYMQAMGKTLGQFATAQSSEDFQLMANQFERIASAEAKEWLPSYYQSLCYMRMAGEAMNAENAEQVKAYVDKAQAAIDQAKEIAPKESEVHAMQGYVYMGRIWENPMVNGAQYSPMANIAFGKAEQLNPKNPRATFLKGQLTYFTPAFWGGGAETALPMLEKAAAKFASYESPSPIHPNWGKEQNAGLMAQAKSTLTPEEEVEEVEEKGK